MTNEKALELLKAEFIDNIPQYKIASHVGISSARVSQLIGYAVDLVVKGIISMPDDFDYSKSRLFVGKMLWKACITKWPTFIDAEQNYQVLSQLTPQEQLDWVRKSKALRWYQ